MWGMRITCINVILSKNSINNHHVIIEKKRCIMAKLYYQGHGSFRITSNKGTVLYFDPYAGEGYEKIADVVLITHDHGDHNQLHLVKQKNDCRVITFKEALVNSQFNSFIVKDFSIESVDAKNKNHMENCVGFIIIVDEIKIYASGDTSFVPMMETFKDKHIDYTLLCTDGFYNMGLEEAAKCAEIINAKHNIPIHMMPGQLFSKEKAVKYTAPNKLIIEPNEEIEL